jgi:hypothetical protein
MKRLFLTLAIVLALASVAGAWELKWDAMPGAAGYRVEYKTLAATTWTIVDVATATNWTIPTSLVKGTRYEFRAQAYTGTPPSYSGYSSTIRWTYPLDSVVVEYPEAPRSVILQFGP